MVSHERPRTVVNETETETVGADRVPAPAQVDLSSSVPAPAEVAESPWIDWRGAGPERWGQETSG